MKKKWFIQINDVIYSSKKEINISSTEIKYCDSIIINNGTLNLITKE